MTADGSIRLEGHGAVIECSMVPWDTEIFGFPVAQVTRVELDERADATDVLEAFDSWCLDHDVRLVSCRLDHLQLRESMALESLGFRFIETVYRPRFDAFGGVSRHATTSA